MGERKLRHRRQGLFLGFPLEQHMPSRRPRVFCRVAQWPCGVANERRALHPVAAQRPTKKRILCPCATLRVAARRCRHTPPDPLSFLGAHDCKRRHSSSCRAQTPLLALSFRVFSCYITGWNRVLSRGRCSTCRASNRRCDVVFSFLHFRQKNMVVHEKMTDPLSCLPPNCGRPVSATAVTVQRRLVLGCSA